jgi:FAD synthase
MKEFAADKDLKENIKDVAKFASKIVEEISRVPEKRRENMLKIRAFNEKEVMEDARDFLQERFKAQIIVYNEEDKACYDPKQKAVMSMPYRPAIYIE